MFSLNFPNKSQILKRLMVLVILKFFFKLQQIEKRSFIAIQRKKYSTVKSFSNVSFEQT